MQKLYTLGLDIGIASVGWAILENDPITEDPVKIIKMGVRTFNTNEVPKTGESTAKDRREKRGLRRRTRRRELRMETARKLLEKSLGLDLAVALPEIANEDVYKLRAVALDEKISDAQLCKVVLNLFKRRGFKSNRKGVVDKESGRLLSAISENERFLQDKNYRTFGEAIYKDERFKVKVAGRTIYSVRNHDSSYKNCIGRNLLLKELGMILDAQKAFGNDKISNELKESLVLLFDRQRNFDDGPGSPSPYSAKFEIGKCTFIKEEKRAPKATFTFEYFTALSKINSLRIDEEELTKEEKETLYSLLLSKEKICFKDVRKILKVANECRFNLCRYRLGKKDKELTEEQLVEKSEKSVFVSMRNSYEIRSCLGLGIDKESVALIDEIATMLTLYKSDERIDSYIKQSETLSKLDEKIVENIKKLNYKAVGSLSIRAMQRIIPFLLEGCRYDEACKKAGFNHSSFSYGKSKYLKGVEVEERIKDITSPVVKRSVNQTIRIINEIVKRYGSPQYVSIELARDISLTADKRREVESTQKINYENNESAKSQLAKEFNIVLPTGRDLLKYKLYVEQDGKCMYSGEPIDISRLFEQNYVEIDHILPYSRSMNDGFNNKVLVLAIENQNKRNRTPYEYFGDNENRWNSFVARVNLLKNAEKKRFLLKKNFGADQQKDFISRNLNDTRYVSKFLHELIEDFLLTTPSNRRKRVVRCVNGAVTNYLRRFWGINKIREDGDVHHAIDATIVATVTDGMIRKVTQFNNMKETFYYRKGGTYVNKATGEIMTKEEKVAYEKEGIDVYSKYLPKPYEGFIEELTIRSKIKYTTDKFSQDEMLALAKLGYENEELSTIKPIFVSKRKEVKKAGAIHKETIMSLREYLETKKLISTVSLDELKLDNKPEEFDLKGDEYPEVSIQNYYRPKDDRLLYLKIKKHLKEQGAYKKGEYEIKPRSDGSEGPIVKKVKVYEYSSSCVLTPNGGAANDKRHRVDVFKKDGKFYLCPVYMADVYAKKLPNKVIEIRKDWVEIDETFEFLFSLYKNDLIRLSGKDIKLSKEHEDKKSKKEKDFVVEEIVAYYVGVDINSASMLFETHDGCYSGKKGVKNLYNIEKLNVDIIGNVFKASKEERKGL